MYLWEKNYKEYLYRSNIFDFYFDSMKIGVFDIETTGLSPDKSRFILGGLITSSEDGIKVQQFFADSLEEEGQVLNAYLSELSKLDILISYNGDSFDLPFLNKRLEAQGLSFASRHINHLPFHHSFDLYRILDRYSTLRKLLPNLKQKTLENFMGLWTDRADEISGKDSVDMYYKFLRTADDELRETILLHNRDDVLQLSRLIKILEKFDLHKALFHTGFPIAFDEKRIFIKKIDFTNKSIKITGYHKGLYRDLKSYGASHYSDFSLSKASFYVDMPYRKTQELCFVDLEEFHIDLSPLYKYPSYESGYLIIKQGPQILYREINHLIKLILLNILKEN